MVSHVNGTLHFQRATGCGGQTALLHGADGRREGPGLSSHGAGAAARPFIVDGGAGVRGSGGDSDGGHGDT
eukprot:4721936-Lingulodinium_polyedra.AAC.1